MIYINNIGKGLPIEQQGDNMNYNNAELIRVWDNRFIIRNIVNDDSTEWDELEERLYERWNDDINELDCFRGVWGFEHKTFYEVVNVDNYQTEYLIQGNVFLGDKWSCYYDSREEMEENEDMDIEGDEVWVRVGINKDGDEYVTYSVQPESV